MADKLFKLNDVISVEFQATAGSVSANLDIYDETGIKDALQSGAMVQLGTTNLWRKSFTPDVVGVWLVQATDSQGGKASKSYSVGTYNIETIGTDMAKGSEIAAVKAKTDVLESNIRGSDNDTLKTISDQLDSIVQIQPMIA